MKISRFVNLATLLDKKSHFLFGPRQTGKSTLIREQLPDVLSFNLLESDTFAELSARPGLLRERVKHGQLVCIDEIQKLPILLDEVHWIIEERGARFLLTGSSPRKLRRGGNNLLGGRARSRFLFPLCSEELGGEFDLSKALNHGLLPSLYFSDDHIEDAKAYIGDYLTQEIAAEALVRNVPSFSRFLQISALFSARQVNFEKLASDAQVSPSTVRNYFQILQDTLVGATLSPVQGKGRFRVVSTPKFYLFDTGVTRQLQGRQSYAPGTPEFGEAFEAFIFHELRCFLEYRKRDAQLEFFRTYEGHEIDFIVNSSIAIEVKASGSVSSSDIKGMRAILKVAPMQASIVVTMESHERVADGITFMPWRDFLGRLWSGELF